MVCFMQQYSTALLKKLNLEKNTYTYFGIVVRNILQSLKYRYLARHKPLTVSPRTVYGFVQERSYTVRNLHCVKHLIDHKNWSRKTTLIQIITIHKSTLFE